MWSFLPLSISLCILFDFLFLSSLSLLMVSVLPCIFPFFFFFNNLAFISEMTLSFFSFFFSEHCQFILPILLLSTITSSFLITSSLSFGISPLQFQLVHKGWKFSAEMLSCAFEPVLCQYFSGVFTICKKVIMIFFIFLHFLVAVTHILMTWDFFVVSRKFLWRCKARVDF